MRYKHSDIDRKNQGWFANDHSRNSLKAIEITQGHIRGISNAVFNFSYPITAIAGRNGSGKSTVLSLACCAFHNKTSGFNPKSRKNSYYTFSDFFIQAKDEIPPDGIAIEYSIASEQWEPDAEQPEGRGTNWFLMEKKKNGKWSNYNNRFFRDVIFFGIDRVVPHNEKTVSKSYRKAFSAKELKGWETNVASIVGKILNRTYDKFHLNEHSRYRLPVVQSGGTSYSGFNMGAGENALFEIISTILAGPEGMLIVIDEIELGLHEEAQIRLMKELKDICYNKKCQIICTTHSSRVLKELPPDARLFLEKSTLGTKVIPAISPAYATGKLSGIKTAELEIFVEDHVAKEIVESILPSDLRARTKITFIGSDTAITRHMTSMYREKDSRNVCAIFDGDKATKINELSQQFLKFLESVPAAEKETTKQWFLDRSSHLPGDCAPEKWLFNLIQSHDISSISAILGVDLNTFTQIVQNAKKADTHTEFQLVADSIHLNVQIVQQHIIRTLVNSHPIKFQPLRDFIASLLKQADF